VKDRAKSQEPKIRRAEKRKVEPGRKSEETSARKNTDEKNKLKKGGFYLFIPVLVS